MYALHLNVIIMRVRKREKKNSFFSDVASISAF